MLSMILRQKRTIMGWTGLAAIVIGLLFYTAAIEIRIFVIAAGVALVCLALPRRIWPGIRTWWSTD